MWIVWAASSHVVIALSVSMPSTRFTGSRCAFYLAFSSPSCQPIVAMDGHVLPEGFPVEPWTKGSIGSPPGGDVHKPSTKYSTIHGDSYERGASDQHLVLRLQPCFPSRRPRSAVVAAATLSCNVDGPTNWIDLYLPEICPYSQRSVETIAV